MSKPKKLLTSKKLSGLAGVRDVSFGAASPEQRQRRDFSKSGVETASHDDFDDVKDRQARWDEKYGGP